jgi:hypothetical protein
MNTSLKSILVASVLTVTSITAAQADRLVILEHTPYTDEQVIVSTVGCAVLFGALAAMTSGISTAVGAVAGGSICAIGFGEDYIKRDRIVGYESGA